MKRHIFQSRKFLWTDRQGRAWHSSAGPETAVPGSTAGVPESLERPVFLDSNLKPVGRYTETQHSTPTCTH